MSIANLPRYEMGRCSSCGDCNRDPAYVDESGEWVKFEEAMEASSNSLQQLKEAISLLSAWLHRGDIGCSLSNETKFFLSKYETASV